MNGIRLVTMLLVLAGLLYGMLAAAQESRTGAPPPPGSSQSAPGGELDRQLLEGLGGEPAGSPPATDSIPPTPADRLTPPQSGNSRERGPSAQIREGEDVSARQTNPVVRIGRQMESVAALLRAGQTAARTQQLQQAILADLDALLAQLQQNRQSTGQQRAGSQTGRTTQPSTTGAGRTPPPSTSRASSPLLPGDAADPILPRARDEIWGHLPPQIRQQLRQGVGVQFLPQYEQLIEQYYRRLAEDAVNR